MSTTLTSSGINLNGVEQTTKLDQSSDTGKLIKIDSFTGSGIWYKPAGCNKVHVKLVGGGGGSAYHCESGGAGGYAEKVIDVSTVNNVYVTVGGGGGNVSYYAAAGDGGTTSFGSYLSASGGYGANRNYSHTGGVGGVGSSGNINLYGGSGTGHGSSGSRSAIAAGGLSYFGGGYAVSHNANYGGVGNTTPGGGGAGGPSSGGWLGANGAAGIVIIYSYT